MANLLVALCVCSVPFYSGGCYRCRATTAEYLGQRTTDDATVGGGNAGWTTSLGPGVHNHCQNC